MPVHWGVDSYNPANHMIRVPSRLRQPGGAERQTLYEFVTSQVRAPDFWGRYLNAYSYGLTAEEKDFIFERSQGHCRILLVYNGPKGQFTGPRAYDSGYRAAERACELAQSLNVADGVRIYADLEGWSVDANWLLGWWECMYASRFAGMGGMYGRGAELPHPTSFEGERPWHPRGVWSTNATEAAERQSIDSFPDLVRQIVTGQRSKPHSILVWSNMPRRGGDPPLRAQVGRGVTRNDATLGHELSHHGPGVTPNRTRPEDETIPTAFRAVGPSSNLIETVIWQYRLNCSLGTGHPLVDMDLATQRGYSDLWARTAQAVAA